jgi:hypothetical protein
MKKMKHFTLLEIGSDAESPMIGTILNITNDNTGKETFKQKFLDAVSEHFDIEDFNYDELPDLFCGSPYEDIMIEVDGANYEIRILETWLY